MAAWLRTGLGFAITPLAPGSFWCFLPPFCTFLAFQGPSTHELAPRPPAWHRLLRWVKAFVAPAHLG